MNIAIRRIRADEGPQLRELRLHALADAPTAFASTLAGEEAFEDAVWHARAVAGATGCKQVTVIAEQGNRWVGLATGLAAGLSGNLQPVLVGMFVVSAVRGRGVGCLLVAAVVKWARAQGTAPLVLWVTSNNAAAIALYRRCGFRPTGATKPMAHTPALAEIEMVHEGK
jgi:GNAT superfamily N-acetyltransferase